MTHREIREDFEFPDDLYGDAEEYFLREVELLAGKPDRAVEQLPMPEVPEEAPW